MSQPPVEAVLVDMGGVILEMAGGHGFPHARLDWRGRQEMTRAIRTAGARIEVDELEPLVFAPWRREYERRHETGREASWKPHLDQLRRHCGCQLSDLALLRPWFGPYGEHLVPIAGAVPALARLADAGFSMALVSNVPLPGVLYEAILARHDALAPFDLTLFSYDCGSRKPLPAMLRRAMSHFGVEPSSTLMVGDRRERDIAAGRFAGTRTAWIRSADAGGPRADLELDRLAELPSMLRRWRG